MRSARAVNTPGSTREDIIRHVNYYFDDPKLRMRKKRFGLRIRIIDGDRAFVTLKQPAKVEDKSVDAVVIETGETS